MKRGTVPILLSFVALAAGSSETQVREILQDTALSVHGKPVEVSLLEVTYPPGGASKPHTHACPVVGYVVSGAVRMQSGSGPEKVYRAGDAFVETANAVHQVSANASQSEPAKFVAYFACGQKQVSLSTPVSAGATPHEPKN